MSNGNGNGDEKEKGKEKEKASSALDNSEAQLDDNDSSASSASCSQTTTKTGTVAVTSDVAAQIHKNLEEGHPGFKPELGMGGVTWILSAGEPYTAITPKKGVIIPAKVEFEGEPIVFTEEDLKRIWQEEYDKIDVLGEFAAHKGKSVDQLNSKERSSAEYRAKGTAEKRMWLRIAALVAASDSGVGIVELKNSEFSKQGDGEFLLVANEDMISIPGGKGELERSMGSPDEDEKDDT